MNMRHLRTEMAAIVLGFLALPGALRADEITLFEPAVRGTGTKVLHFPPDQCVGNLWVPAESVSTWDPKRVCPNSNGWEHGGTARGDVAVRGDRAVELSVWLRPRPGDLVGLSAQDRQAYQMVVANRTRVDPEDLAGLSGLGPDDLYWLLVSTVVPRTDADRLVLEPIQRLTGLQILTLEGTGVTGNGMERLRALRSLKALQLSRGWSSGSAESRGPEGPARSGVSGPLYRGHRRRAQAGRASGQHPLAADTNRRVLGPRLGRIGPDAPPGAPMPLGGRSDHRPPHCTPGKLDADQGPDALGQLR